MGSPGPRSRAVEILLSGRFRRLAMLGQELLDFSLQLYLLRLPFTGVLLVLALLGVELFFACDQAGGPLLDVLLTTFEPVLQICALLLDLDVLLSELLTDGFEFCPARLHIFRRQLKMIGQLGSYVGD